MDKVKSSTWSNNGIALHVYKQKVNDRKDKLGTVNRKVLSFRQKLAEVNKLPTGDNNQNNYRKNYQWLKKDNRKFDSDSNHNKNYENNKNFKGKASNLR